MCGIIGFAKGMKPDYENVNTVLDSGLKRLSYRGYDSWGTALSDNTVNKATGEYPGDTSLGDTDARAGIGHVRWATHGGVTTENAHPHISCDGRFQVVHNGVIENWEELKENHEGHTYTSETDTEVIAHIIEHFVERFKQEENIAEALHYFDKEAEGNYAILVMDTEKEMLYALKRGSPLVFGYEMETDQEIRQREDDYPLPHSKGAYFGSDLYALSDKISEAFFMKDGDIIMSGGANLGLMRDGEWLEGFPNDEWVDFEWTEDEPVLEDHRRYWMEKEIHEIPDALNRLDQSLVNEQHDTWKKLAAKIHDADRVILTASGTSYHAALIGVYYLQQQGIEAQALIASEFENYERVTEDTLLLAISQSGETRDVLDAIQVSREQGAEIASLVNVPYSTIQRKSDLSMEIKAQQENCVAATKTFANQVYLLMHLAGIETENILEKVKNSMKDIHRAALVDATQFHEENLEDIYIIGNASTYPIAREIALKLKEISYIHAEGMMAGELKHGTLALIEEGTPVIALDDGTGKINNSVEEVEARGAATKTLVNDENDSQTFVFQATIYGFFLAMYWAHLKQLPVDRPRNLAKVISVQ